LTGDVKTTLSALLPLLTRKADRSFLSEAQRRMSDWNTLLDQVENTKRSPLRPQMVIRALSDLLPDNAVISLDCGANTHFAARCLKLRANQRLTGTGMLASMAPGLSYGIAASYAFPDRPSIVITGDGGFSMLMAELVTATSNKLPVKIILLKNNSLAEVKFEQEDIGNPEFGCELAPIDFVAFAKACGAEGYRCEHPEDVVPAIKSALESPRTALVEAIVDPNERPAKPEHLKV
jgi:pyruvate dehydrogenase (quinone)